MIFMWMGYKDEMFRIRIRKNIINIFIEEDWENPIIKHISINAAAALLCSGNASSLSEGYDKSMKLFKSDAVIKAINYYKEVAAKLK